jgi:hypothetical protein
MNVRSDNLKCLRDTINVMDESLRTIHFEINKLIQQCETLRAGLIVEQEIVKGAIEDRNPLNAPEIVGADKNGDGGFAFRMDEDNG